MEDYYILVENGIIKDTGEKSAIPHDFKGPTYTFAKELVIVPGYIDIHIHGANNADTMDATKESIDTIAQVLAKEGTTSFLPTTITQSQEKIESALQNAGEYIQHDNIPGKAEVIGIHLEGPFINPIRKGAQPDKFIIESSIEKFDYYQSLAKGSIKLVTLAPEQKNGYNLVQHLRESGVIASIGHSDANFDEVKQAVDAGATHITHLFNGMKGIHHRDPGTAGGALLMNELYSEIIADGFHIHPNMIDLAIRLKGMDRTILVTDSMRAKWLSDGESELGGQKVYVKDGKATLESGNLAGSILKMSDAVKNIMKFTGINLPKAVKLATINPAKQLGIDNRKGSLEKGKDADIVILDEQYSPVLTICRGSMAYKGDVNYHKCYSG
jgi:N-acetylglucosamine-6-phosphate deacetylase